MDCRRDLYESILISGGTSMFPGFPTRLDEDIRNIYKSKILKNKAGAEIPIKIEVLVMIVFIKRILHEESIMYLLGQHFMLNF